MKLRSYLQLLCVMGLSGVAVANTPSFHVSSKLEGLNQAFNQQVVPRYTATFNIKKYPDALSSFLMLRYYQAWGDGSREGWQQPVTPPLVILDGKELTVNSLFAYDTALYAKGSWGMGYDQYAQYLKVDLPLIAEQSTLTISGSYQQVAYFSATVYTSFANEVLQDELVDQNMVTLDDAPNPYHVANFSVFAYHPDTMNKTAVKANTTPTPPTTKPLLVTTDTGALPFYRLDQNTSNKEGADDITADGCSQAYLAAYKSSQQQVEILRIKVPHTFIASDQPDTVFDSYQTRYFSVSAQRLPTSEDAAPNLEYWSVNARMLADYQDAQGYAYVFFVPNSYAQNLALEQHTPKTQPPLMHWGNYTGYALGDPDFEILLRYKVPDPNWQGNPHNATCYSDTSVQQPVTVDQLGVYIPEAFGDSLDNFEKGHIGSVAADAAWPETSQLLAHK